MSKFIRANHLFLIFTIVLPINCLGAESGLVGNPVKGATHWANNCSRCHHMRNPQDNTDDEWEPIITHMRIRAGLSGYQARDILSYLQSVNHTPLAKPTSEFKSSDISSGLTGEQIYSGTCIACHGADGSGAIPGIPSLSERMQKTEQVLFKHVKEGFQSPGSSLAMPARGGNPNLTDKDIKNVVNYLQRKYGK